MPSFATFTDHMLAPRWQACAAEEPPSALLLQPGFAPHTWEALLARSAIWGRLGMAQGSGWQVVLGANDGAASDLPLLPDLARLAASPPLILKEMILTF